jgi:hypothetical protein
MQLSCIVKITKNMGSVNQLRTNSVAQTRRTGAMMQ